MVFSSWIAETMRRAWPSIRISAVLAGFVLLAGCDATLSPFAENTGQFSIYGYLTLSDRPHFIRVKDLTDPPVPGSTKVLDAKVRFENLETGRIETLADSVVLFDGVYTHNFRVKQRIHPGTSYRITVKRPDGRFSQATATMPNRANVEVNPPKDSVVDCFRPIQLRFREVSLSEPRLIQISVGIVRKDRSLVWVGPESPSALRYTFAPWRIIRRALPRHVLNTVPDSTKWCSVFLGDDKIRAAYTHFGPDWPADSVFMDPTASTVKNGLGVFGGLYRDTVSRRVDTSRAGPSTKAETGDLTFIRR